MTRSVFALVALLWATSASAKTFVIAVGNNFGQRDEPTLRYAERDAARFVSVLRRLGRVGAEDVVHLSSDDAQQLRAVLIRTNARLRDAQADGPSKDALIVYYSGHADASGLHLGDATLPFEELETLVRSSPARVRVLIVDSCRSGGATQIKGGTPSAPFDVELKATVATEGVAIITSSAGSEDSQESETLRASFFTHHLVSGLRGAADGNRDNKVTLDEAYAYAYRETLRSTGRTLRLQHPTYLYDLKGKGEFVVTYLGDDDHRQAKLQIRAPGTYLIYLEEEDGPLVAEAVVEKGGAVVVLPPGRYFVQKRESRNYREYELSLTSKAAVVLDRLPFEEIAYARLLRKGGGTKQYSQQLSVLAGARGSLLAGETVTPNLLVGYGVDFSWLSFAALVRYSRRATRALDGTLSGNHQELGLRLRAERLVDLAWFSVGLGLFVEGVYHRQAFTSNGTAPVRDSWALGFGGTLALERDLLANWVLRVEGGPVTQILSRAQSPNGFVSASQIDTPLTWYGSAGVGLRF